MNTWRGAEVGPSHERPHCCALGFCHQLPLSEVQPVCSPNTPSIEKQRAEYSADGKRRQISITDGGRKSKQRETRIAVFVMPSNPGLLAVGGGSQLPPISESRSWSLRAPKCLKSRDARGAGPRLTAMRLAEPVAFIGVQLRHIARPTRR